MYSLRVITPKKQTQIPSIHFDSLVYSRRTSNLCFSVTAKVIKMVSEMDTSTFEDGTFPGSELNVDEIARNYSDLLKIPTITKARFEHEDENVLTISSEWTYSDVVKKEKGTLVKNYTVLKSSLNSTKPIVYEFTPNSDNNVKLTSVSKSGLKKAVVLNKAESKKGEENGEFLQVFSNGILAKTFDLKEIDKHGGIYNNAYWGSTMTWSPDETKLAYLAEKKVPKHQSFLAAGSLTNGESANSKGQEYAFRQSWGEQLNNVYESVIIILDMLTEDFAVLPFAPELFPSDLQWVNNATIIGTCFMPSSWRLGMIYCTNRESRIFKVGIDGSNFTFLSNAGRAVRCPRVHTNGNYVIWQERYINGPHQKSRQIMGLPFTQDNRIGTPSVLYENNPTSLAPIYEDFPQICWTPDGSKLITVTPTEVDKVLLIFTVAPDKRIIENPRIIRGIQNALYIGDEYILASRNSVTESTSLVLLNWTVENASIIQLTISERVIAYPFMRLEIPGSVSPASFYYGPSEAKPNSVPLVVMPHGGPHSVFVDEFIPELALFLRLGYGVLRLNYVGSLGGTKDVTENLLGKIGVADLIDCQNSVRSLLSLVKNIDPKKIVIHGGSHGGFLGAHLTSSFPEFYKAAVLRNPVVDLLANTSVSDITDWQYTEAGIKDAANQYLPYVKDLESAAKLMKCSPIHQAQKVEAATLLLLGSEDLRVPMSQGQAYYRTLKAANKVVDIRVYDDCHPLMKVPCRFDAGMQSILWFAKYLKVDGQ